MCSHVSRLCLKPTENATLPHLVANLANTIARSCHRCTRTEYAAVLARMVQADMLKFSAVPAEAVAGFFGVWKTVGSKMRLICDMRPANCFFETPPMEHTGGDALTRMQVPPGCVLWCAKLDLSDYFHACRADPEVSNRFFGLRSVRVADLTRLGVSVGREHVDAHGLPHPRLTTLPMGFGPSPARWLWWSHLPGPPSCSRPVTGWSV